MSHTNEEAVRAEIEQLAFDIEQRAREATTQAAKYSSPYYDSSSFESDCARQYTSEASALREAAKMVRARSNTLVKHLSASVPEQSQWLPIESCPRNGLNFLACSPASSVFLAHWANGIVDSSFYIEETGYQSRYATHWMPLPDVVKQYPVNDVDKILVPVEPEEPDIYDAVAEFREKHQQSPRVCVECGHDKLRCIETYWSGDDFRAECMCECEFPASVPEPYPTTTGHPPPYARAYMGLESLTPVSQKEK